MINCIFETTAVFQDTVQHFTVFFNSSGKTHSSKHSKHDMMVNENNDTKWQAVNKLASFPLTGFVIYEIYSPKIISFRSTRCIEYSNRTQTQQFVTKCIRPAMNVCVHSPHYCCSALFNLTSWVHPFLSRCNNLACGSMINSHQQTNINMESIASNIYISSTSIILMLSVNVPTSVWNRRTN